MIRKGAQLSHILSETTIRSGLYRASASLDNADSGIFSPPMLTSFLTRDVSQSAARPTSAGAHDHDAPDFVQDDHAIALPANDASTRSSPPPSCTSSPVLLRACVMASPPSPYQSPTVDVVTASVLLDGCTRQHCRRSAHRLLDTIRYGATGDTRVLLLHRCYSRVPFRRAPHGSRTSRSCRQRNDIMSIVPTSRTRTLISLLTASMR